MIHDTLLHESLEFLSVRGGSDLHIAVGTAPTIRIDGDLQPVPGFAGKLSPQDVRDMLTPILSIEQRERFERDLELDFAYSAPNLGRFRVNFYQQRNSWGAAFRYIDSSIRSLDELNMPKSVRDFAFLPRGLVLVTGPTGSGKSTTLAALIDVINAERACHVMTIEDPIEFLHRHKRSIVNQREVGTDTHTFDEALKHVLRQDPDVILIGELRDHESISIALTAAETGHLVFATLHTVDAAKTIDRIVDVFESGQQAQIRTQLASALQGVISQTLLKRIGGGRVVATELLRMTPAIANLVREEKTHQIYSQLQAGGAQSMHTMDQSLAELVRKKLVTYDNARDYASQLGGFESLVTRASVSAEADSDRMASSGFAFNDEFGDTSGHRRQRF